ncbi:hypothetical protein HX109_15370 [Galbibacter sp. BG1]|uniref:PKD domain-containing protein n=1 Tax=Galbibacter sp. BG1 TaxID=1170699 RepID=UPI0015BEFF02|nr:hypothetical protein [Galbibacter sp. BG1]QLE02879.1 hypothetical protein HX109_15370 [Galbibacter sp. BG1]
MNYYIDIIDTTDGSHVLVQEYASRDNVELSWNGSDEKDALIVVGSALNFNMLVKGFSDAHFIHLFTSDETKYRVEIRTENEDKLIWIGHLLTDTYSEPYTNSNLFVSFSATDGLGRLKGKLLSEDFYSEEKSVIGIIAECLRLTGLELDILFSAAIENVSKKLYHNIYLSTENYLKKNKRADAYSILQKLLEDMVCCVYQADGRWYVEGLNKRHLRELTYFKYNFDGTYDSEVEFTRLLKEVKKPLLAPQVTMVPAFGEIAVSYTKKPQSLPETIAVEKNDGWAVTTGVYGEIYASDWRGFGDYYAKALSTNEYKIKLDAKYATTVNDITFDKYIYLAKKIYVKKGQKLSFEFSVSNLISPLISSTTNAYFANGMAVEINLGSTLNLNRFIASFGNSEEIDPNNEEQDGYVSERSYERFDIAFDILIPNDGLLDINIARPFSDGISGTNQPRVNEWFIEKIKLEPIEFVEDVVVESLINQDYTVKKEIDLQYGDDSTGFSQAFRLDPIDGRLPGFLNIDVPVVHGFQFNNENFAQVSLEGANLIKDNIETVLYGGSYINDIEVIYNWEGGEQMVVKTPNLITSGNFTVELYRFVEVQGSRAYWEQWTDSIYQIESDSYAETVAKIFRRMFSTPHEKIDMVVNDAIKFNDMIAFDYIQSRKYVITNCKFNLDNGKSTVTMVRNFYQGDDIDVGDNIPPIVDCGPDIYISENDTSVNFDATAYDPDGFIASYQWTKISGPSGDVISSPAQEDTSVINLPLSGDLWEYQLTVTDNQGAQASDRIKVFRARTYEVSAPIRCITNNTMGSGSGSYVVRIKSADLNLNIPPNVVARVTVGFKGVAMGNREILSDTDGPLTVCSNYGSGVVQKNGIVIWPNDNFSAGMEAQTITFNMINTDQVILTVNALHPGSRNNIITVENVELIDNPGTVSGLPISYAAFSTYSPL